MKREFLLEFKVGEQSLPKEVIDAIMAENGRDIQKVRSAFADYETLKTRLAAAEEAARDAEDSRQSAADWEEKYTRAVAEHAQTVSRMTFDHKLDAAIGKAGGRNATAIRSLLDLQTLQASEDQPTAIEAALQELKSRDAYLFETETAPPYEWGTGAWQGIRKPAPTTLAGALKERFERK